MYKLLLAEHSDIVIKEIMDKLDDRWDVRICSHGPSVSDMLDEFAPDVLVIYANLPGKNAVNILSERFPDLPDLIVALVPHVNKFTSLLLSRWGVDYLVETPLKKGIFGSIVKTPDAFRTIAAKRTMEHLRVLGFHADLNGYYYLLVGIPFKSENPTSQLHGELYSHIASVANADEDGIERAIRKAIEAAWKNRSHSVWSKYFPVDKDGEIKCPNNKEMISTLALKIK